MSIGAQSILQNSQFHNIIGETMDLYWYNLHNAKEYTHTEKLLSIRSIKEHKFWTEKNR